MYQFFTSFSAEEKEENEKIIDEEEKEDDDEIIDPMIPLKEECKKRIQCIELKTFYDACKERVNSDPSTIESCAEELYDYTSCLNHCISKDLFNHLK
ncbi:Complex III subunit 6 [Intoshia linei]|uniref:Cytochrome b-c1 complex subunit 6 n=1 Tax=Intoshia linei TaxID=1819745 RepID=A0A177BCI7_9BILA|nr:Complex III subunit 6 [Intoshia linei]